jgi:predicted O-methyltransferase YrrM
LADEVGVTLSSLFNVARFIARNPSRAPVLANKVLKRIRGESDAGSQENDLWLAEHSTFADAIAKRLSPELWSEALDFDREQRRHAQGVLAKISHDLGGGGDHKFLYWLTRYLKPKVVVETGVAAGWSSRAFLVALRENGGGRLYSSDLPYFRLPNPDRFAGILVEAELRDGWTLYLEGDEANLPRILAQVGQVDLFHYDSDKMRSGREFAISAIREKLSPGGVIVMDDIFNDDWFKDYVTTNQQSFAVVEGRYGVIGSLTRPVADGAARGRATSRQTSR